MTIKELFVSLGYKVDEQSKKRALNDAAALKSTVSKLLGTLGITVTLAGVIKFGKDTVQAASDVEQMEQKFNVVFDGITEEVDSWAGNLASAIGRSKNSIKTYLADNQNLLVGFGMARETAAALSEQMVQSAIDIASFANLNEDDAVNAMSKALLGESEAAKRLGAVLNDNTIAMAMESMGLKGKLESLDEATKMQVRYTAIMLQSKDAVGDAERSMGSYESNSRKLNATLKDIRENVGRFLLPYANKGLEIVSKLVEKARDVSERLGDVNVEGTTANRIWKTFSYYMQKAKDVFDRVVSVGRVLVKMLGGADNAMRLLLTVVGAFLALKAGEKIAGFAKGIGNLGKMLGGINIKAIAVVAAIVLLVLIVQDFIYFLQGKNSLFGKLLENAGVDTDGVRQKFIDLKEDLGQILSYIKDLCAPVFEGLREFWEQYGPEILSYAQQVLGGIVKAIGFVFAAIGPGLSAIVNLVKAVFALLEGDTNGAIEALQNAWSNYQTYLENMGQAILSFLDGLFGGLPSKALAWGRDMMQNFISGITEKISALKEKITEIGDTIKEKLHFSKPDNGPLADSDKWMPDMMDQFIRGIEAGKAKLRSSASGVADLIKNAINSDPGRGIAFLASSAKASFRTATGSVNNNSRSIIQNLNFSNTFNGGDRQMQSKASSQMQKDARDAGTYLANALELAR